MSFKEYWIPIFKKEYFKAKLTNDFETILAIRDNIKRNWSLSEEEKIEICKLIKGVVWWIYTRNITKY